jgi:copper chaperone CopZ
MIPDTMGTFLFTALIAATTTLTGVLPGIPPALGSPDAKASQATSVKGARSKGLRHATFQVIRASCVACLRDTERKIRKLAGVKRAQIGITRPYRAVVLYDSRLTRLDSILAMVRMKGYDCVNLSDRPVRSTTTIRTGSRQRASSPDSR